MSKLIYTDYSKPLGISITLFKSRKQVSLTPSKSYEFTEKDLLTEDAIRYYNSLSPLNVKLFLSNPAPVKVEPAIKDNENVNSNQDEVKDIKIEVTKDQETEDNGESAQSPDSEVTLDELKAIVDENNLDVRITKRSKVETIVSQINEINPELIPAYLAKK